MVEPARDWSRRRLLGAGAATGLAFALGACNLDRGASVDTSKNGEAGSFGGELLDPPFPMPDQTLTDFDEKPFPLRAKAEGRLTILFFGYTHCPDVCPVYLNTLASARSAIGSGPGSRPLVLFVGVDVPRDTPKVLKTYLGNIDQSFIGLTGPEPVIKQTIADLRLAQPVLGEPDKDGNYAVGHPSNVFAFSPKDGMAHRMYPSNIRQSVWVKDLPRLDQGRYT